MKRLNFILGAAALAAFSLTVSPAVSAQENGNRDENGKIVRGPYETNRFGDNWFIGVGGGINIFLNEGDVADNIVISPSIDANLGKWFTPAVGMRVGYQGIFTQWNANSPSLLGNTLDTQENMYPQKMGYMYVHGDFLWNISNAIGGYKETRFWNFVPYIHTGYFRSYGMDNVTYINNELALGAGLLHNLRLADRLDLIIDMRATVVNGRVNENTGVALLPTVTAGLAVDLGWPNFIRTSTILDALAVAEAEKTAVLEAAIVALEAANASLAANNENLTQKNTKLSKQVKALQNRPEFDVESFFEGMTPAHVFFEIGKATLDARQMAQLDFLAKNIIGAADQETNILVTVMGSADSNTGSQKRNQHLSEARAKYIFDLLTTKYGISPDRLTMKTEVVKNASDPALSRAVVFTF
jgi:outer membrane protein OmpA-like peptidoglycan-associated protein